VKRVGLLLGAAFGFLIAAARLNEYDTIHNMLLLQDPYVFLMMGSAVATAAPLLWLLQRRGWQTPFAGKLKVQRTPVTRKTIFGAAIFGTGWALSGSCPGPILALPAAGTVLGVFVIAGVFAGIALHDAVARLPIPARSARPTEPAAATA
jgi:uncharacterized membrane protein YedE/YeeE